MRRLLLPLSLLVAALTGCGSDILNASLVPATPAAIVLSPNTVAVDTAGTLQFEARGRFADGTERLVPVTFTATGGEISSGGLYRASVVPGAYRVIATCACGVSDTAVVVVTAGLHALGLLLTPATATLDTSASLQFTPAVVWSDSADHPAQLSYSATGGTVTAVGLYRAGTVAGSFQVIASCNCGVADTSDVAVTTSAASTGLAGLSVGISGLPQGLSAAVSVSGPGGFSRTVTASAVLDSLAPGDYEVRASGLTLGNESYGPAAPAQSVTLAAGATGSLTVSYRVITSSGLPSHPRVWMTPARIARLQAQVTAGSPRWLRVKSGADAQLAKGAAYSAGDQNLLPDLCLAYLGTRDVRYAQRAGVVLGNFAVEANDLKYDSGYGVRFLLPVVSMGLDWCYDGLTIAQRQQTATWLMNRADWTWPETNPARKGLWGTDNAEVNYWWGFMMTGPAALAAAGDDVGPGDRPSVHRQLAMSKWIMMAVPFTENSGGAWAEGTNYESTWRAGAFVDAFATSGIPLSTSFLAASLRWRIHSLMPGNVYKVPFGAQPRSSDAAVYSYDRMHALYALSSDPALAGEMRSWLDAIGSVPQNEFNETAMVADELLRYDPTVAARPISEPLSYFATKPGFFVYRQSWTDPNGTVMAFESGPTSNAGARDANGLMIWKGSFWITATANIYSQSGIEMDTRNYNNLTVGGVGQYLFPGNGGTMQPPQVSDGLVAVRGQAKKGYGYQNEWTSTRFVSDYVRTVAYLPREDVFVIVDQVAILNPLLPKVWRWHMRDVPQVSGNTFRLQSQAGDFRCFGTVLTPTDVVLGTESYALGNGLGVSSNAVTVTMAGRASDVVVTVLQCTGGASAPFTPSAAVTSTEAAVTVAGRRVVVPLSENNPVRIE